MGFICNGKAAAQEFQRLFTYSPMKNAEHALTAVAARAQQQDARMSAK